MSAVYMVTQRKDTRGNQQKQQLPSALSGSDLYLFQLICSCKNTAFTFIHTVNEPLNGR